MTIKTKEQMKSKIHKRQTNKIKGVAFTMCGLHDSQVREITKRWERVTCKRCLKLKDWIY